MDKSGEITDSVVIELEPIDPGPLKGPGEDQAQLLTFRGKRNKVQLGKPKVSDYLTDLRDAGNQPPKELAKLAAAGYSILSIRPALTLLPDWGCLFTDVDFSIEFFGTLVDGQRALERPLACDVRPVELMVELPFTHTAKTIQEIGGEAGAAAGKLIAKLTRENAIQDKGSYYLRRIYGYGTGFYTSGWRLRTTAASALEGDIKELEVIVQVPKGAKLSGRFRVAAEIAVETTSDRWLTRSFGPRHENPPLDVVYPLQP
jgi:hypothetical protein